MNIAPVIGRYQIIEETGRGGFAVVYKARDTELDRLVALKILSPAWSQDDDFVHRFRHEAKTAASLRHPAIVTIHDTGSLDGYLYIAMEYLPGQSLRELLQSEESLSADAILAILQQIGSALDYAHGQQIIHRDVKPANVIVEQLETGLRATLVDFGLVKAMAGSGLLTTGNHTLGTPQYMAPEQADPNRANEVGPAADRYALGVMAYELLAGRPPFPGNSTSTLYAHEHKPVPSPRSFNPIISESAAEALLQMLAKDPASRFPNARDFVKRLQDPVHEESKRQALYMKAAPLYRKLQTAVAEEEWNKAITLASDIQALIPNYADVPEIAAQARAHLQFDALENKKNDAPLNKRRSGLIIGALIVILLAVLALWAGWRQGFFNITTAAPTAVSVSVPIVDTPTDAPSSTPTEAPSLTPSPAPTATDTPMATTVPTNAPTASIAPSDTPTATPTNIPTQPPSPTPTSDPRVPPATAVLGDVWIRPSDQMSMQYLPEGAFMMGSADDDQNADPDEFPQHSVALDSFWIDKTEITNAQYQLCVGENFCVPAVYADNGLYSGEEYPVVGVSWEGAQAYCSWADARLPTEAQWEYAARGDLGTLYPWIGDFDGRQVNFCDVNCPQTWQDANYDDGYSHTSPVGNYTDAASWAGVLDLGGNVWEWTADWYDDYPTDPQTNPTGPATGTEKVLRGGGWYVAQFALRAANRLADSPHGARDNIGIGFRCIVTE